MVILYLESLQTLMYNCHTLNDQWEFTMNVAKYILDTESFLFKSILFDTFGVPYIPIITCNLHFF